MQINHKHLHNILPAFRGPDKKSDKKFKIITVAIRSYLGFTPATFKGQLLKKGDYPKYCGAMSKITRIAEPNHYQEHLLDAIDTIGELELLRFVRDNAT